jgi:acetone carboxylase gamma subunit
MSHGFESTKDKMLEAYPNLEKSITICQAIEKMVCPYCKFYDKKKANTVQFTLNKFFMKN